MRARALAVGVAAALVTGATPASATPTVEVVCQSRGGQFSCFTDRTGGSPMTVTWTRNGVHVAAWDGLGFVFDRCVPDEVVTVVATVTDPTGSASDDDVLHCNAGPWP